MAALDELLAKIDPGTTPASGDELGKTAVASAPAAEGGEEVTLLDGVSSTVKLAELAHYSGRIAFMGFREEMEKAAAAMAAPSAPNPDNDDSRWKSITDAIHARHGKKPGVGDTELARYEKAPNRPDPQPANANQAAGSGK